MSADSYTTLAEGLHKKTIRISYNHCGICGRTPKTNLDEPNYAPVRWWDPDDGWKVGTLCSCCFRETFGQRPKATDFAAGRTNGVADAVDTDEDPIDAIPEQTRGGRHGDYPI